MGKVRLTVVYEYEATKQIHEETDYEECWFDVLDFAVQNAASYSQIVVSAEFIEDHEEEAKRGR